MLRAFFIEGEVKESISLHLYAAIAKAVEGYLSASEDEDTLTGGLGENLRISNQKVTVPSGREISGTWTWSISYHKFRGRGKKATENFLGADGMFELSIDWNGKTNTQKKCILFQAKNQWQGSDKFLLEQCIKLSTWREASFVLNYTPTNYETFFIDDVIRAGGSKLRTPQNVPLAALLSRHFLECLIGDTDLRYDASARKLIWKTMHGETVETQFTIGHRFSIKIKPPKRNLRRRSKHKEILNSEIHRYRMKAREEDILSLAPHFTDKDIQRARKNLALAYHPDKYRGGNELLREILTRRMQEFNNALDVLHSKLKRK